MPALLTTADSDFESDFRALLNAKREEDADVDGAVAEIIADVRARGAQAVIDHTARFDDLQLEEASLRVDEAEIDAALEATPTEQREALSLAAERIEAYHRAQLPEARRWTDAQGVALGWRWTPVDAAGLYAPGGLASYPSSVLMNAIPARIAGVSRLALCAPTPKGRVNPLVLCAARLAGVDEIYRIGGAQAIAALAYGAGPIAPVDVIVGPGNAYVAAAKRRVYGRVGIDSVAGPSEVVVVAMGDVDPDWIAADLLAQDEHDPVAQSILITPDPALAEAAAAAVSRRLDRLPRRAIAGASWRDFGAVITVRDLAEASELVNRLAPEHLELLLPDAEAFAETVRHAGAIFLGAHTPEALGDYVAGPNHVLPTARSARHASGLSVLDFMKRTTLLRASPEALRALGPAADALAMAEGLEGHAASIRARLDGEGSGA
ncbi:MAG: histidinol dehydrogenase [Pseudomonadota bacterium]